VVVVLAAFPGVLTLRPSPTFDRASISLSPCRKSWSPSGESDSVLGNYLNYFKNPDSRPRLSGVAAG
jgi:hypothetical protein